MPGGGTLTISTGVTRNDWDPAIAAGDYICIRVADTGQGMTPEVLARATEPFYSTKPLGKGTGLGLAQVYGIARQSGGTLRIHSEPGQGASIDMLIPAAEAPEADEIGGVSAVEGRAAGSSGARILVVDDDSAHRAFHVDSLRGLAYKVTEAGSGAEALDLLDSFAPDLALIDYAMPGMNGAELAHLLRNSRPALPILFVTGYAESDQLNHALGPDAPVLRKPFSIGELAAAVQAQVDEGAESGS
jgi:CheY-like chemotaxis protein